MIKKIYLLALLITGISNAASIDYLINNSVSYFQNPSQTGKISVEGIFYNPAGTVFLEDGTYVNISGQLSSIDETMNVAGNKYAAEEITGVPSMNILHKQGKYSFFGNIGPAAGGATLHYDNGVAGVYLAAQSLNKIDPFKGTPLALNAKLEKSSFVGSNKYYMGTLGSAYKVTDKLSFSLSGRYIYATRDLKGNVTYSYKRTGLGSAIVGDTLEMDSKRKADGFGFALGMNYQLDDTTNLGIKYDSKVKLNFKSEATENSKMTLGTLGTLGISSFYPTYKDGAELRRDLPAVLSLGVSKKVNKLTGYFGYNYYFNEATNMDGIKYEDGFEFNVGMDYQINPRFIFSTGFNYAITGAESKTYNDTEYALDSRIYALGLTYITKKNNEFKLGMSYIDYSDANGENERTAVGVLEKSKVEYSKSIIIFGLGYTHKF